MKLPVSLLMACTVLSLSGCVPRIEVAAPEAPITINMNVKIEHEIHIKVDKDVESLLKNRSDLFGKDSGTDE
ncbi:YnbE family lipoprotein [Salmonella enterica subsp. enterica serovar Choleraesuis]|nr:YnbE family lipoprotein [Salmonella enterica subsp. enterica serovar Choleraesuis]